MQQKSKGKGHSPKKWTSSVDDIQGIGMDAPAAFSSTIFRPLWTPANTLSNYSFLSFSGGTMPPGSYGAAGILPRPLMMIQTEMEEPARLFIG